MNWHRGTDQAGRSCHYLAGSGLGVVKIEGLWFIHDFATGENLSFRTSLTDAKNAVERMAERAA